MVMPHFLVIGAAKSGTSSLYHYLNQHPQIYMSPVKEPAFFAYEGQKVEFAGPGDERRNRSAITEWQAYHELFSDAKANQVMGEASVVYLYNPIAPERIKHYIPDVKLIAILRNPVDRALSNFMHFRRDNLEPVADFTIALSEENKRIAANWQYLWHYTNLGFYGSQLRRYYELFPHEQIALYTYEDFSKNQSKVLQSIFHFLGVDESFQVDTSFKHNISGHVKIPLLHQFLTTQTSTKKVAKALMPADIRLHLRKFALKWNVVPTKPAVSAETYQQLRQLYRSDLIQLQSLTGLDLTHWLNETS